jgi:hypothetical protein
VPDSPADLVGELSKMTRLFSAAVFIAALYLPSLGLPSLSEAAGTATLPYNDTVQTKLQPQIEALLIGLVRDGRSLTLDGIPVFNGKDRFLPGKIAISLVEFLLSLAPDDPRLSTYLKDFRQVARLTVDDANDTWGAYYYALALDQLRKAGLLQEALDQLTLAKLRVRLDWRMFVDADDFALIDHPNNYYCVALGLARLRQQMGWEDGAGAQRIYDKIVDHYRQYSGEYGFADETDGEGRFDRYSVLLSAELAHHFVETSERPPPEVLVWLRKSADVMLSRLHEDGTGFEYGRSLGPYGETAIIEVLTIAATLHVLSDSEKALAYAYASRAAQRYFAFWTDKKTGLVNLWDAGRRTDAYRGKFRILGENLSLAHQYIYTNSLWNAMGFKDTMPIENLAAALRSLPRESVTWFARGHYDRMLLTRRDGAHVIGLPLINGGPSQHMHSPYFPIPFARDMLSGVADGTRPLLLPQFSLADGTTLMPLAFIQDVKVTHQGRRTTVIYRQSELDRVGGEAPIADDRLSLVSTYVFETGRITRTDVYTPKAPLDIAGTRLDFASFSTLVNAERHTVRFGGGAVTEFKLSGLDSCEAESIHADPDYESDLGPMATRVVCSGGPRKTNGPFTISWSLAYR